MISSHWLSCLYRLFLCCYYLHCQLWGETTLVPPFHDCTFYTAGVKFLPRRGGVKGAYNTCRCICRAIRALFQKAELVKTLRMLSLRWGKLWVFCFTKPVQQNPESVMATYSVKQTCWLAGLLHLSLRLITHWVCSRKKKHGVSPWIKLWTLRQFIQRLLRKEMVIRPRLDVSLWSVCMKDTISPHSLSFI